MVTAAQASAMMRILSLRSRDPAEVSDSGKLAYCSNQSENRIRLRDVFGCFNGAASATQPATLRPCPSKARVLNASLLVCRRQALFCYNRVLGLARPRQRAVPSLLPMSE